MLYYLFLTLIIITLCYVEYADKKKRFLQAKQLNQRFNEWVNSKGKTQRPNNAVFADLYFRCYKTKTLPQQITQQQGALITTKTADVVASFPSLNGAILETQFGLLDNLDDYYTHEYQEIQSLNYLIQFIVSMPLRLLRYVGLDETSTSSKLFQIIFWVFSLFLPPLKDLVLAFIEFLITKQR